VTAASHSAFVSGIHVAFVVAAAVCAATGLAGLFITQPQQEDSRVPS
jgi:hypothetical protein